MKASRFETEFVKEVLKEGWALSSPLTREMLDAIRKCGWRVVHKRYGYGHPGLDNLLGDGTDIELLGLDDNGEQTKDIANLADAICEAIKQVDEYIASRARGDQ